jgi:hypothetical protein
MKDDPGQLIRWRNDLLPVDTGPETFGGIATGSGSGTGREFCGWVGYGRGGAEPATFGFIASVTGANCLGDPCDVRTTHLLATAGSREERPRRRPGAVLATDSALMQI